MRYRLLAATDTRSSTVSSSRPPRATVPPPDQVSYASFRPDHGKRASADDIGAFDFKGKYKWDAWNKNKGMSKEDAQKQYYDLLDGVS